MTPSEIADWLENEERWSINPARWKSDMRLNQAAATTRAQAEALKIATEALEEIAKGNRGEFESGDHMAFDKLMRASQALARIKEVG